MLKILAYTIIALTATGLGLLCALILWYIKKWD